MPPIRHSDPGCWSIESAQQHLDVRAPRLQEHVPELDIKGQVYVELLSGCVGDGHIAGEIVCPPVIGAIQLVFRGAKVEQCNRAESGICSYAVGRKVLARCEITLFPCAEEIGPRLAPDPLRQRITLIAYRIVGISRVGLTLLVEAEPTGCRFVPIEGRRRCRGR
jgi:hypothetical protein